VLLGKFGVVCDQIRGKFRQVLAFSRSAKKRGHACFLGKKSPIVALGSVLFAAFWFCVKHRVAASSGEYASLCCFVSMNLNLNLNFRGGVENGASWGGDSYVNLPYCTNR